MAQPTDELNTFINVALFFIMFLTSFNLHTKDIIASGKHAMVVSILAFTIPFFFGTEAATLFGFTLIQSVVVGLTISMTAVPVNAIILMELVLLNSKLGRFRPYCKRILQSQ